MMPTGDDLLARIKPTRREEATNITLRPDLIEAWEEATEELSAHQAAEMASPRLGSKPSQSATELAQRVADIEAEIEATQIRFLFRAMSKDQWRALCDDHPPRPSNQLDAMTGYDRDAVLDAAVRECMVEPEFSDLGWAEFVSVIGPGEWEELRNTVNSVNRGVLDAPKSVLASRILSPRASGSEQPVSGA